MTDQNQGQTDAGEYTYTPRQIEDMEHRAFRFGDGKISGTLACTLGVLSLLTVLCFKFPQYLTTTELRAAYDAAFLQQVLKYGMFAALGFGLLNFVMAKYRRLASVGILSTAAAFALGGYSIPLGPVEPTALALGLDWLILALVVSAILFIFLEKVFPKYRDQVILRPGWELDTWYFAFNHLLLTVLLLIGNGFVETVFGWAIHDGFQATIQSLPTFVQVIILIIAADFVLYWSHRFFHENPDLWKFHAVHHSTENMDWMAGSRNHVFQTITDRCLALVPLYLLGTTKGALDIYVGIAAFQAVYVHSNVNIPVGPLKYIFCTPQYHHWHHSSEEPAIDTNYAVHTPLFDKLFGTYHMPGKHWPAHYGTVKKIPTSFWGQMMHPWRKDTEEEVDAAG